MIITNNRGMEDGYNGTIRRLWFSPEIGIKVLIQKSLITIDSNERFGMHDLIQEMGHYIVRGEHPNNPEKHSRLWKHAEVSNMCFGDATVENDQIGVIEFGDNIHRPQSIMLISKMKKLRWLHLRRYNKGNGEAPNYLSNELRYINWSHYPASPFPDSFQATNLVFFNFFNNKQKLLWKGYKHLPQLKVLQLVWLEKLDSTPDFNGLPRLQKLVIINCWELEEIHPSLGNHRSLKYIDALLSLIGERCTNLIYLSLHHCFNLNSIEVKFDGLKCLKEFECSKGPEKTPFPLPLTRSLRKLDLSSCCFEDGEIQSNIAELSNLQDLNLSYNNFSKLHFSLSQLTRLKLLNLSDCKRIVKLPELPSSIAILSAVIDSNRLVQSMLKGNAIKNEYMLLRIRGVEIPKQIRNCLYAGDKCGLSVPENWCNDFLQHSIYSWASPTIIIWKEASDEMRGMFHVVWGKSFGGKLTCVWAPYYNIQIMVVKHLDDQIQGVKGIDRVSPIKSKDTGNSDSLRRRRITMSERDMLLPSNAQPVS
ncbi:Toll/interleukin-1 receptor domain-containing protein [Tanacetum coccineum]